MPSAPTKTKLRAISWLGAGAPDPAASDDAPARPRKPPRRARPSHSSPDASAFPTMASLAAVIMEASSPSSPCSSPKPAAVIMEASSPFSSPKPAAPCPTTSPTSLIAGETFRDFSRSIFTEEEKSPSPEVKEQEEEKKPLQLERRRWLLILIRVLIFVVFLTVGTKKIALGISISAVAALIAETLFKGFLPSGRAWEEEEQEQEQEQEEKENGLAIEEPSASTQDDNIVIDEDEDENENDNGREWSWNEAAPLEFISPVELDNSPPAEEGQAGEDDRPRGGKVARRSSGMAKNLLRKLVRKSSAASIVDKEE